MKLIPIDDPSQEPRKPTPEEVKASIKSGDPFWCCDSCLNDGPAIIWAASTNGWRLFLWLDNRVLYLNDACYASHYVWSDIPASNIRPAKAWVAYRPLKEEDAR